MKIFLLWCLLLCSTHAWSETPSTLSGAYSQISLPSDWNESLLGQMVYDVDYVLTEITTGDLLLIQVIPKGFIFNDHSSALGVEKLVDQLQYWQQKQASQDWLKVGEQVQQVVASDAELKWIHAATQMAGSDRTNHLLITEAADMTLMLKFISNDDSRQRTLDAMRELAAQLAPQWRLPELAQTIESPFALSMGVPKLLDPMTEVAKDPDYPYLNQAFSEDDRLSLYLVSSQCSGLQVPAEQYAGLVTEDYGFNELEYNHSHAFMGRDMTFMLGGYDNSKGDFQMITAVISQGACQHVVAYVVETDESLLDRFFHWLASMQFEDTAQALSVESMNVDQKTRYAETLQGLADVHEKLKDHAKAQQFYEMAFAINPSESLFFDLADAHYDQGEYQKVLQLIEQHGAPFTGYDSDMWRAWSLAKLGQNRAAIEVFELAFEGDMKNDEDFFEYLELLDKEGEQEAILEAVKAHRSAVADLAKLKVEQAKVMVAIKRPGAEQFLVDILTDPLVVKDHQYTVMNLLGDLQAYEPIVAYIEGQFAKGYDSAVLWNYLGDAQNQMGQVALAYQSMQKAHAMMPHNKNIKSYLESLRQKVGKSDYLENAAVIEAVALPAVIQQEFKDLQPQQRGSSYEYIYQVDAYYHEPGQKNKRTRYGKKKINTKGGVQKNKTIQFAYNDEYEAISVNAFRVLGESGQLLAELDQSSIYITHDDDGMMADNDKLLNIPVPALDVGVSIEWVVTTESKTPDDRQEFIEVLFVSRVAHQYKGLLFTGDLSNIQVDHSEGVVTERLDDSSLYWREQHLADFKKTPMLPDLQDVFPWVKLASVKDSWLQVGDDYLADIQHQLDNDLSASLPGLGPGLTAPDELSRSIAIAEYVQGALTYQAIEFGWRAWLPNPASTSLKNQYGDCKDHAVLLRDLLQSAGIEAHLALVNSENDISLALPNMGQFDHMIVYLPTINGGSFVDVTHKNMYLDMNNPPPGMQGYHTLVLQPGQSKIVQIPMPEAIHNSVEVNRQIGLSDGEFLYQEQARFYGYWASGLRHYLKGIEADELESKIMAWVSGYYPDLRLVGFSFVNLYEHAKPLELTFEFAQDQAMAAIKLPVFTERYVMEFDQSPNRVWDFQFNAPFKLTSSTRVKPGDRLKLSKAQLAVDNDLLSWRIDATKKSVDFAAEVYRNTQPAAAYQQLVKDTKLSYQTMERLVD